VIQFLSLATSLCLIGPGALSPTDPGALENVERLRLRYGWGLDAPAPPTSALIAVEDCRHLGSQGIAVVDGLGLVPVRVVDCQRRDEAPRLHDLNIVADVSDVTRELGHRQAWLVLWRGQKYDKKIVGQARESP
jgi:hypothetical protein